MASGTKLATTRTTPAQLLLERVGPHATKIMLGAAIVGLIAAFLNILASLLLVAGAALQARRTNVF